MDLRKRLASLDKLNRKPSPDVSGRSGATENIDASWLATEKLGLEVSASALGHCHIRKYQDVVPGQLALPDLTGFFTRKINPELGPSDLSDLTDVLFLDTETTGLVGGTGTMAFLVGVSWFEAEILHTWQYFLCSPANEPAMLEQLHLLARRFTAVATFNGSSFDLPLLRTRALLNRMSAPWDDLTGLDLLVPARRLWGRQLDNCRQQTVEKEICCLIREGLDIEGHLIPQTWFDFLKLGRWRDMKRVLYHNHRDMVGMAHILGRISIRAGEITKPRVAPGLPWQQCWSLGRIAELRNEKELSIQWLMLAWEAAPSEDVMTVPGTRFLADALRILKRSADWPLVEKIITRAIAGGCAENWLHREAAILHEHRLVDLPLALRHAKLSGEEHRVKRLQDKLQNKLQT